MPQGRKTILLAEHEVVYALNTKETLNRAGYSVVIVTSGTAAVEVSLLMTNIALILMDIDLGSGMNGIEAAETILAERDIPIILLSSQNDLEIAKTKQRPNGYRYVVKGTTGTALLDSVKEAVGLP